MCISSLSLVERAGRQFIRPTIHFPSKYRGFAIIIRTPRCMRHLEELVTILLYPVSWFLGDGLSISFCIISGLPLLDTGFHGFLLVLQSRAN